jgi:putative two-component system response regulator
MNPSNPQPHRLLVVDDEAPNRAMLKDMVEGFGHVAELASDGIEALAKVKLNIDLVLLDLVMPGMDGFEVAQAIRGDPENSHVPIVVVTSLESKADRLRAAAAGANDFIAKPVDLTELKVRTTSLLKLKEAYDAIRYHTAQLKETVEKQTGSLRSALIDTVVAQREIYKAHVDTINRLAIAAEFKDEQTAFHIERMSLYSVAIGKALGLPPGELETLRYASAMHDVGKIGIPDAVLLKPGKLNADEWAIMKAHTLIGARILGNSPSKLLQAGEVVAMSHQEKWDGTGYPNGLAGEKIPLWGRICAVADVFDALTTKRPYKPAFSNEKALGIIREGEGTHFDPKVVQAFFSILEEIQKIQREYPDQNTLALADQHQGKSA